MKTDNELIAEFMGKDIGHERMIIFDKGWTLIKYHTSWDWLMPVVEKIWRLIENRESLWYFEIDQQSIGNLEEPLTIENPNSSYGENNLTDCYGAVVEFIKWYNKN